MRKKEEVMEDGNNDNESGDGGGGGNEFSEKNRKYFIQQIQLQSISSREELPQVLPHRISRNKGFGLSFPLLLFVLFGFIGVGGHAGSFSPEREVGATVSSHNINRVSNLDLSSSPSPHPSEDHLTLGLTNYEDSLREDYDGSSLIHKSNLSLPKSPSTRNKNEIKGGIGDSNNFTKDGEKDEDFDGFFNQEFESKRISTKKSKSKSLSKEKDKESRRNNEIIDEDEDVQRIQSTYRNSTNGNQLSFEYEEPSEEEDEEEGRSLMRKRPRRSVVHLYDMVVCATDCNPLAYKGYGCYCGFLGSGLTVDGIDRCCAKHDWCYHHAKCPPLLTYFVPYYWTCNDGRPKCVSDYRGWKGICGANLCECDRQFAECLRKFPCPRSRAMCMTSPWRNLPIGPNTVFVGPNFG